MEFPDDLQISIDDIRKAGHCARMRGWFQQHGLYEEFKDLVKGGSIAASKLAATGDPRALQVIRCTIERGFIGIDLQEITVTAQDVTAAMKCRKGSRAFAARYGFDYEAFLAAGIPAADLVATEDLEALAVVRHRVKHG